MIEKFVPTKQELKVSKPVVDEGTCIVISTPDFKPLWKQNLNLLFKLATKNPLFKKLNVPLKKHFLMVEVAGKTGLGHLFYSTTHLSQNNHNLPNTILNK